MAGPVPRLPSSAPLLPPSLLSCAPSPFLLTKKGGRQAGHGVIRNWVTLLGEHGEQPHIRERPSVPYEDTREDITFPEQTLRTGTGRSWGRTEVPDGKDGAEEPSVRRRGATCRRARGVLAAATETTNLKSR